MNKQNEEAKREIDRMIRPIEHCPEARPSALPRQPQAVMPFASPAGSPCSSSRPQMHRRTRSCSATFSDDKGPGAFSSLGALPKRKPLAKKAVFHLKDDQADEEHSGDPNPAGLFISLPPNAIYPGEGSVPFPSSSALLSPLSPTPPDGVKSPLPRTSSSPIILSNGKPLKPSLKSASTSPQMGPVSHLRAQSAPTSPFLSKNVHFAESDKDLESVRVFNRTGKPANIAKGGEDTETETEADNASYFPFSPPLPTPPARLPAIDPDVTTPVPNLSTNAYTNIHIETINFPKSRPAALYGSILVRNVAFEKQVALRFTLDNWQTTSEVLCKHVISLPGLPPPFPRTRTVGDAVGMMASGSASPETTWDRFSFCVHMEYYEQKLPEQTIWFVGRFTSSAGEWWDNNDGKNYRVGFKQQTVSPTSSFADLASHAQQRSFTAPSTMKPTPITATIETQKSVLPFPSLSSRTSPVSRDPPLSAISAVPTVASPSPISPPTSEESSLVTPTSPVSSRPSALAERRGIPGVNLSPVLRKMSLTNYAAPTPIKPAVTQTPTPPRSRSGSLEALNFANLKGISTATSRPAPRFISPRSSPPRVESPVSISPSITPKNNSPTASTVPIPSGFSPSPLSQLSPALPGSDLPSAEMRAALVKQWCFAQSTPPTPGVFDNSPVVSLDVNPVSGSSSSSSDGERDLADEILSPAVENHYSWWVGSGSAETSRGAGGGWFWSGDHNPRLPQPAGVGVS